MRTLSCFLAILLSLTSIGAVADNRGSGNSVPKRIDAQQRKDELRSLRESFTTKKSRESVYGSVGDKACTDSYIALEQDFLWTLERINKNGYSIYYIVACLATETVEDTLYNEDSDIYGKVGSQAFSHSLDFLFGTGADPDSDRFKDGMKSASRYFVGYQSADGCANFYDDLVKFGYIDESTGYLDAVIQDVSNDLCISRDALYAIFDEFNLYQETPIRSVSD